MTPKPLSHRARKLEGAFRLKAGNSKDSEGGVKGLNVAGNLALGIGLLFALYNCVFVIRHYIRMPYMDQWLWVDLYYKEGLWRTLLTQHNEHRLFFPGLAYALDQEAGHGLNLLLLLMTLAAQLMTFLIVWLPLREVREFPRGTAAFMAGATAVFATWFLQAENLFQPYQFCLVLSSCLCVAAFYCLAKALTGHRAIYGVAAGVCLFVATFSFASGAIAWPLLIAVCLLKGTRRLAVAYSAGFALTLALYMYGYQQPRRPANPLFSLTHKPWDAIYYWLIYLGRPFVSVNATDFTPAIAKNAAIIGAIGLILCAGLVAYYLARPVRHPGEHVYVWLMLWTVATGFVTALGRINYPAIEVLGGRYVSLQILFWYGLTATLLFHVVLRRRSWSLLAAEIMMGVIALACVLIYPNHRVLGELYATNSKYVDQQASAAYAGVFEASNWPPHAPIRFIVESAIQSLRQIHRGPFAFPEAEIVGKKIDALRLVKGCQGFLDQTSVTADQHGVKAAGWAWGADQRLVDLIALVDASGKIVGWGEGGLPRPDVAKFLGNPALTNSGWAGYAPPEESLRAFALSKDRQSACLLPPSH